MLMLSAGRAAAEENTKLVTETTASLIRLLDLAESVLAPVHITLNGEQFTDAGFFGQGARIFALHLPIALAAVSPAAGPEAGGTRVHISGTQLTHGARTQCRCCFGD